MTEPRSVPFHRIANALTTWARCANGIGREQRPFDGTLRIWDVASGRARAVVPHAPGSARDV